MSAEAESALSGREVYIKDQHTFEVTDQNVVIAKGSTIMVFPPNKTEAEWWGKDTGENGQTVKQGYTVFVNNATVVFRKS